MVEVNIENLKTILKGKIAFKHSVAAELEEDGDADPRSGKKVLDHVTTYDADGKKIEEIEYNSEGQKWRKRFEYAPGAEGKCIKESVYNERNRLESVKKYEYNEFGRKKTQYNYNAKGKLLTIKVFEYIAEDA